MTVGNGAILFDASGNPIGVAQNASLNATQTGLLNAGSDYTSTPKSQLVKVDSAGTLYTTSTAPGGAATLVYNTQAPPATTSQYGPLGMIQQNLPTPATYVPMTADMNGNLFCHLRSKPTFRAIARQITTGTNKYLMSLTNPTTTTWVMRLYEVRVYVTPSGVGASILGSSGSTYYPMFCEIYRVSAANVTSGTGALSVPVVSCDSADTLISGVTVTSSPTISTYTASLFRCDAVLANAVGQNFYERRDLNNEKSLVIRPGEGMALICLSNGTVASATGGTTLNAPVDVTFVFSQAPA